MLSIKERKNDILLISLRETGFPRPTSATHYAIHYLAEIIASMHERSEISEDNTFPIKVGVETDIFIKGAHLPEGEHKINLSLTTMEAGTVVFDITDMI